MAGIGDGLGYGANTKAAIITRALREMVTIGEVMGATATPSTDCPASATCMATCLSEHGRNRRLGEMLGRGHTLVEAEAALCGRVAEGLATIDALRRLRHEYGLEMPIVETLHQIIYMGLPPRDGYLRIWHPGAERDAAHDCENHFPRQRARLRSE
jgi:glycerol-3-phosphate dehydrogenase (NAD(P)+)